MAVCKYFSVNRTCLATKDNEFVNCNGDENACECYHLKNGVMKPSYIGRNVAEWILIDGDKGVCSNCHRQDRIDSLAKFCRYCGAQMKYCRRA